MDLDEFLRAQWREHETETEAVAQRLAGSTAMIESPAQVGPYAALVTHVYGVHLARWADGAELLRALRRAPGYDGSAQAEGPIARSLAALGLAAGDETAAEALAPADRIAALANASSALLDRDDLDRAIDLFDRALALAATTPLADGLPAIRALAVGGNNLAAALEDRGDRTPAQSDAMLRAARAALTHWKRCGGWLEHERAEYRLARSALRAGQAAEAVAAAQRCVALCDSHDAPPFERFFGHAMAALAHAAAGEPEAATAQRTLALQAHAAVAPDEQGWCADDLAALNAALPAA